MVIKKVSKLNADGTLGISLPHKLVEKLNWTSESFVNISIIGDTLHIVKVKIE